MTPPSPASRRECRPSRRAGRSRTRRRLSTTLLAAILVQAALAVFVAGAVVAAILWAVVSADVGALTLSIAFAGLAGLMVLRQALLAERR